MAPRSSGVARRGRGNGNGNGNTGRSRRNAYTNAGINRGQLSASRGSYRVRGAYRRRADNDRTRHYGQTSARPSLASRITHDDAGPHAQMTEGDDNFGVGIDDHAASAEQVNNHDSVQTDYNNTTSAGAATTNDFDAEKDVHIDIESDIDIDDLLFNTQRNTSFSQQSALFCGFQPTQPTEPVPPLTPSPPSQPTSTTFTSHPIRMLNQPFPHSHHTHASPDSDNSPRAPGRSINPYRGKDPIKRLVQNKKLQAIFADRPVPKERKKPVDERMELRLGMKGIMK